jgi:hypothetical protein
MPTSPGALVDQRPHLAGHQRSRSWSIAIVVESQDLEVRARAPPTRGHIVTASPTRLGKRDGVELVVAEAQRGGVRNESTLVAHDVFDELGTDVSRLHDLSHGASGGGHAEDLDEEREME